MNKYLTFGIIIYECAIMSRVMNLVLADPRDTCIMLKKKLEWIPII
jgi:hypothetical protein